MTLFKDLNNDVPVSSKNVQDFINQYSPEIVQGYMMAIKDIFGEIESATFRNPISNTTKTMNSDAIIRNRLFDMLHEKSHLLATYNELGLTDSSQNDVPKL